MAGSPESMRTTSEHPGSYEFSCLSHVKSRKFIRTGGFRCGSWTFVWTSHVSDLIAGVGTETMQDQEIPSALLATCSDFQIFEAIFTQSSSSLGKLNHDKWRKLACRLQWIFLNSASGFVSQFPMDFCESTSLVLPSHLASDIQDASASWLKRRLLRKERCTRASTTWHDHRRDNRQGYDTAVTNDIDGLDDFWWTISER